MIVVVVVVAVPNRAQPPEMRLAQFARTSASGAPGETGLYGLPEMEVSRSQSNVFDSSADADAGWPAGSKGTAPLTAAAIAASAAASAATAATAAAASSSSSAGGSGAANSASSLPAIGAKSPAQLSPDNQASPILGPTLTPARVRNRSAEADGGGGEGSAMRRKSHRSSRTSGTSASPPGGRNGFAAPGGGWVEGDGGGGGGGLGPEAAAQGFTEAAELEALQIDKNDLKLVFGRPFARGKSSEVYQVTHAGKNRAAKVIFFLRWWG